MVGTSDFFCVISQILFIILSSVRPCLLWHLVSLLLGSCVSLHIDAGNPCESIFKRLHYMIYFTTPYQDALPICRLLHYKHVYFRHILHIYIMYIYIYSYINFRCVIIMEILKCFSLFRHEFMPFLLRTGGKGEKGKKGEGDWKDGTGWNGAPKTPIESWKGQNIWPGIHRERPDSFSSWVKPDIQTSPPPKKKKHQNKQYSFRK